MIGVFDSGVGGLSVVKHLLDRFNSDIIYLGDTARLPYGTKSKDTIVKYSIQNANFLVKNGIDALVVACNSASAASIDVLKKKFDIPVFGVIEPASKKAARFEKVCVIGTTTTIESKAYLKKIKQFNDRCMVIQKACPLFVPLVEEGWIDDEITLLVAKRYLEGIKCDAMILGCTHYPLLRSVIEKVLSDVYLIDSGESLAESLEDKREIFEGSGRLICYTTDSADKFSKLGSLFLGKRFNGVKLVDLG